MAERPGPTISVHLDHQLERRVPLHGSLYRIGRDPNAEVLLEQAAVSRRHALLERRGNHWLLSDAGSTNGLWWQGRRVRELLLRDGDRVRLGPPQLPDLPEISFHDAESGRRLRRFRLAILGPAALAGGGLLLWLLGAALVPIREAWRPSEGRCCSTTVPIGRSLRPMTAATGNRRSSRAIRGC